MLGKLKAKYIQSLGHKKHRDEEHVFVAEGPKIVEELLHTIPKQIRQVFALPGWIQENAEKYSGIDIVEVNEIDLGKISQLSTPNQVLAVVQQWEQPLLQSKGRITLVLDTIQDPGNLGTIIRIADWFGVSQIVCSHGCADMYNPKVVQSTMGSIARVKILYTDIADWLKNQQGTRIYAAMLDGIDMHDVKTLSEGILVIGNESKGISSDILPLVNVKITIPRKGNAESLNAAVAAGILLSHLG